MIKLTDIIFEGKLSKSEIKKMRDKYDKTGKLPPHLQKLADLMKKNKKMTDVVVPGLEWMAEEKLNEKTTKDGFEAIKQFTYGKPNSIQFMTKGNWMVHIPKGIRMGVGKNSKGIVEVRISKTGKDKWKIEFFKSYADEFGLSQQGKGKYKPVKVVKNVEGNMLHSTFKGYLRI
jgi:hypothetical protein